MSPRLERWYVDSGYEKRRGRTDRALNPTPPPPTYQPQFLGDPGENKYMIGWAFGPGNDTMSELRANPGYPGDSFVSVIHDYSGNNQGIDTGSVNTIMGLNMIPSQSIKFKSAGSTPAAIAASIASGARDAWLDTMYAFMISKAPKYMYCTYHHEPGGEFGSSANTQAMKDYRDAYRRIVLRGRAAGVTNVMWQPILETPWNFAGNGVPGAPVSGSPSWMDFRYWHPDWDWRTNTWFDDITMDMFGIDLYVPMINGSTYRQFGTDMSYVQTKLAATGAPPWPFTIMEHGMNNDAIGHDWPDYATKKRDFMKANNVKLTTYWDNSADLGRYSFGPAPQGHNDSSDFDDDGTKKIGYNIVRDGSTKVVNL